MDVPPPQVLNTPLVVPSKILMGPGPSNCPMRILEALGKPTLGHMHPETLKIMDDVKEGIRYIFQTKSALTLAVSASGHGGMEAVLCNLLEDGDTALIGVNGIWGERALYMAQCYGAIAVPLRAPAGSDISLAQIEGALIAYRPRLLFLTQGESSTGVLQRIEGVGALCRRHGVLLAVDTVASLGAVPFRMDAWAVDAVYTGSQKVLGAPAGITPIAFSEAARERILARNTEVKVWYWDMRHLGDYWNCFGRAQRIYHHTISTTLLYGLREALALLVAEGLDECVRRHGDCARALWTGLERLRLRMFVEEESRRLPSVTTIVVPQCVEWRDVTAHAMKKYGVEISGGLGPTVDKVFRIGLMGINATPEKVEMVLEVLEDCLNVARSKKKSKL